MRTWDLLPSLGFIESAASFEGTGRALELGPFRLSADCRRNRYLKEVIIFEGAFSTSRTFAFVNFEFPLEMTSLDLCIALLVYYLTKQVGPELQGLEKPDWFEAGKAMSHLLPWEVEKKAYEARPHCYVSRDRIKLLISDLGPLIQTCPDNTLVELHFDGEVLTVGLNQRRLVVNAAGLPWNSSYVIPVLRLRHLPKRIMSEQVEVGIHNGMLRLDRCVFSGLVGMS